MSRSQGILSTLSCRGSQGFTLPPLTQGQLLDCIDPESAVNPIRTFETGATRDTDQSKTDYEGYLSPRVLRRFGQYMDKHRVQSGQVRDSDNWQKGIPRSAYMKSLLRHLMDLWLIHRGASDQAIDSSIEDVLCAVIFNAMGYLHEVLIGRNAT